ncbi:hypothetical protein [Corynebacterium otitidis]|uniref:hypothetical protein n=1 Tax=Corynebacterium otitidis TaxID=29321 RepID=UPI0006280981|nr:hypothetical protein [Corynebacterium otitidis]KKO84099.1 hypothetical protein AAV33_02720 [Corynebacterium otitidis]
MFHVKPSIFVRLTFTVEGVGSATHAAHLEELDDDTCRLRRIVEIAPGEKVAGAFDGTSAPGMMAPPTSVVPHPRHYGDYPDIAVDALGRREFEELWAAAVEKFPVLDADSE